MSVSTKYIGVKILNCATLMTRSEYCTYRGWEIPNDEDPDEKVYLVEYEASEDSNQNHPDHKGYISMSPKDVFEKAYRPTDGITFGLAIEAMKKGCKVARAGWNGKGMFLYLVQGSEFKVNREPLLSIYPEGTDIKYRPHMDLKTADGSIATWSPSGSDALADDWLIVE